MYPCPVVLVDVKLGGCINTSMYCGVSGCSAGWMYRIHPCTVVFVDVQLGGCIEYIHVVLVNVQLGGCIEYIHVLWC